MKVLVIGSGGREHAIAWKISQSSLLSELYCAPGNPGTKGFAKNIEIAATNVDRLAEWAKTKKIDLTIVGPEAPLSLGIADVFQKNNLRIFGPTKDAAKLEWSKAFAKEVLIAAGVRTPRGAIFTNFDAAKAYVDNSECPLVVKADGLAAGKGVIVPENKQQTIEAINDFLIKGKLGEAGKKIVLEDRIAGKEASVMAIVDGTTAVPLAVSQDYKRIFDGDLGGNTGGMGAISPTPVLEDRRAHEIVREMFVPVLEELKRRGIHYRGFLYGGLMIDSQGNSNIIEFNSRLGDPETQVLLMRLESDLLECVASACDSRLEGCELKWSDKAAACVVASSRGYPESPETGKQIHGSIIGDQSLQLFHSGTKLVEIEQAPRGQVIVTNGGRVLCIAALGTDVPGAVHRVYQALSQVSFDGMHYRRDIGHG